MLYLLLLIALSIVEEAIVGLSNGRTIAATLAEIGGAKLPEMLATSVVMLLILIPIWLPGSLTLHSVKAGFGT